MIRTHDEINATRIQMVERLNPKNGLPPDDPSRLIAFGWLREDASLLAMKAEIKRRWWWPFS